MGNRPGSASRRLGAGTRARGIGRTRRTERRERSLTFSTPERYLPTTSTNPERCWWQGTSNRVGILCLDLSGELKGRLATRPYSASSFSGAIGGGRFMMPGPKDERYWPAGDAWVSIFVGGVVDAEDVAVGRLHPGGAAEVRDRVPVHFHHGVALILVPVLPAGLGPTLQARSGCRRCTPRFPARPAVRRAWTGPWRRAPTRRRRAPPDR